MSSLINGFELRFHTKESHFPTDIKNKGEKKCYLYKGKTTYQGKEYDYEHYRWYYMENPAIGCCFLCPKSTCLGYHKYDLEGVTVLLEENVPKWIYYHAHGRGQGMWISWNKCKMTSDGHLIIYVSRYSHASYPYAKTIWRIMGFGNDKTNNDGKRETYEQFEPTHSTVVLYDGEVKNMSLKRPLPSKSITSYLRFWLPFTEKKIKSL